MSPADMTADVMADGPAEILADAQRQGRLPSVVGGLVLAGADGAVRELVWSGGAGDVPGPVTDTQYRIGSISKTFTAVLLLQARDAGLLTLDDPLGAHVPEAPYADRTLRGLLSHTAGLPKEPAGPWWERHDGGSFADLVAVNADVPAVAPEGVEHRYSNLGFGLLGEVAARALGADWWTLVHDRVLAPLGLRRTSYLPVAPHALGWSVGHLVADLHPEPLTDTGAMAPAGQLWSTVDDLATWARFVLHGHPDVLARATLEEAAHEVLPGSGYGLGFRLADGLVGHTGTMPGFMASFFCDRAAGTAYVGMANGTVGQQSLALARSMLAALDAVDVVDEAVDRARHGGRERPAWTPVTSVPDDVRALLGTWFWGQRAFEVRWERDELALVELRGPGHGSAPYEEYTLVGGRWVGTDRTELEVVRAADGSVDHLISETYRFTRQPAT